MAFPISRTITAADLTAGYTSPWAYDWYNSPFICNVEIIVPAGSSLTAYTLYNTLDDLNAVSPLPTWTIATANWVADPTLNNLAVTNSTLLTAPQKFGRLNIAGLTGNDEIYLRVVQGMSAQA